MIPNTSLRAVMCALYAVSVMTASAIVGKVVLSTASPMSVVVIILLAIYFLMAEYTMIQLVDMVAHTSGHSDRQIPPPTIPVKCKRTPPPASGGWGNLTD